MSETRRRGYIPEPTVRESLLNGLRVFADDAIPLLVVAFFVVTLGVGSRSLVAFEGAPRYFGLAAILLIAGPLEYGLSFVCLRAVRSGKVNFEHLIAVLNHYWPAVVANAIISLILPGAFGLLIVPGIYLYCVTRFVPFLLLEDELGSYSAIVESFRLSQGYTWQLLGICSVGLLSTTLGFVSILGLIPALIWWNLSIASLYHSIARPPEGWDVEDQESLEEPEDPEDEE
jgi:hypothetical protein